MAKKENEGDPVLPASGDSPTPAAAGTPVSPGVVADSSRVKKLETEIALEQRKSQDAKDHIAKLENELSVLSKIPHPTKPNKSLQDEVDDWLFMRGA